MALTYTEAVELLEKYGIKVSVQCNGLPVVKACAEVIQGLEGALKTSQTLTSGPMPLRIANSLVKSLRIPAKKLEDGDVLYFKVKDKASSEYDTARRLHQAIKETTGKKVLVVIGQIEDKLKYWSLETKLDFLKLLFQPLTDTARVKLLKDLAAEVERM